MESDVANHILPNVDVINTFHSKVTIPLVKNDALWLVKTTEMICSSQSEYLRSE